MHEPFKYDLHTFDSGLRLVTVKMPSAKTVTVFVLVGTGSKYESKELGGISHFLEHMMFKGTEKRPGALDIARELDSIGAAYNAFTGKEYTGYYAKASLEKLDTIKDVVFDIFLNSKFSEEEIKVEKGVIVEELNMYKDLPQHHVWDIFEELLYGDQPAGRSIVGTKETVTSFNRDNFVSYFNSHYVAENTVVAVAGDIDPEKVKEKVADYFKNIRHGKSIGKSKTTEEQSKPEIKLEYKKTDQTHFVIGVRAYNMFDEKRYALAVLSKILGGGMSSRLFSEIREKRGLAYYVGSSGQSYTDSGYLAVKAGVNNGKAVEAVRVVIQELKKARDGEITADELQKAKDNAEGSIVLGLESSDDIAMNYADSVLYHGKVLTPEEELAKIKAVTLDDINNVAKEIFSDERLSLALIGPFEDPTPFAEVLKF